MISQTDTLPIFWLIDFDESEEQTGPMGDHRLVCNVEGGGKIVIWGSDHSRRNIETVLEADLPCKIECDYRLPKWWGSLTVSMTIDQKVGDAYRAAESKFIPTMAKECRKYGISLMLASQEARDFNVSLFSAIANYLVLRLTEADAKSLVRNVASSQHERTLMDKIKQMARFKALYFCEGRSKPYTVNLSS